MLTLYHAGISTCSQRVRQALSEKNLEWQSKVIKLDNNEHLSADYLALNPNGLVPTLEHNGEVIVDSSVILEYLEDCFPSVSLRPSDPLEIAKMRSWVRYLDEIATAATRYPSFHLAFGKRLRCLSVEQRKNMAKGRPLREGFYLQLDENGFSQELLDLAEKQLIQTFDRVEKVLNCHTWILSDLFTIVDITLLPTIVRLEDLKMEHLYSARPSIVRWYEAIQQRPSFKDAYYPDCRITV